MVVLGNHPMSVRPTKRGVSQPLGKVAPTSCAVEQTCSLRRKTLACPSEIYRALEMRIDHEGAAEWGSSDRTSLDTFIATYSVRYDLENLERSNRMAAWGRVLYDAAEKVS